MTYGLSVSGTPAGSKKLYRQESVERTNTTTKKLTRSWFIHEIRNYITKTGQSRRMTISWSTCIHDLPSVPIVTSRLQGRLRLSYEPNIDEDFSCPDHKLTFYSKGNRQCTPMKLRVINSYLVWTFL